MWQLGKISKVLVEGSCDVGGVRRSYDAQLAQDSSIAARKILLPEGGEATGRQPIASTRAHEGAGGSEQKALSPLASGGRALEAFELTGNERSIRQYFGRVDGGARVA